jgi:hypothetical protein
MAHHITKRDKQQGIKQAWHGLTQVVDHIDLDNCFLSEWEIKSSRLFIGDGNETDFYILTATDDNKVIGKPFAETYKPISNTQFLKMIKDVLKEIDGAKIESVGSVCNRGRVFVSISLKDTSVYKIGNREFNDYLNFGNGHDQSSVLWANNTNVCTVCNNTFSANLNNKSGDINLRIPHKGNIEVRIENLKEVIDIHLGAQANFKLEFERLMAEPLTQRDAKYLFTGWLSRTTPEKEPSTKFLNKVNRLTELFSSGAGNRGENYADAFSAVTDYYTHESTRGSGSNVGAQYVSSEFGLGRTAKNNFWDVVTDKDVTVDFISSGSKILASV